MTDRLKQIWSGFEGVTERRLTGRGIDNIVPPQLARMDRAGENRNDFGADRVYEQAMKDADSSGGDASRQSQQGAGEQELNALGAGSPASVAFAALRTRLAKQEQAALKNKRGGAKRKEPSPYRQAYDPVEAPDPASMGAMHAMLSGIRSTEERTLRTAQSYAAHMSAEAGRALAGKKKRKKFLGIF